jgi:site-specific DNA-methyltransferase (adenine-specific)/modification methylase
MSTNRIQIGNATLYCGDCRTIIEKLSFDSIVTDPPYGLSKWINKKWDRMFRIKNLHSGGTWAANPIYKEMGWDEDTPDLTLLVERNIPTMIFGGNYFALPPSRKWIVWDKGEQFYKRTFAECELCYCSFDGNAKIIKCSPESLGLGKPKKIHPTQKPVAVMQFCILELPKHILLIVILTCRWKGVRR